MYIADEYYEIPYSHLSRTIPTIKLTKRIEEIYSEFNQFKYNNKRQKELLIEYILCYNILNERYLNSMNAINATNEIQIFISHATKDIYFARTIATDLMEAGYSVFLDDWSIEIVDRINEKINEGLEMCDVFVMIISESYLKSVYCKDEWSAFYHKATADKNRLIYPVIIDDSKPPALISDMKYVKITEKDDYTSNLSKLLKALKKHYK